MHYAKIIQIQFVIYGMTIIVRILIIYNDYRRGDIHYESQEKVLHYLYSVANQYNGNERGDKLRYLDHHL